MDSYVTQRLYEQQLSQLNVENQRMRRIRECNQLAGDSPADGPLPIAQWWNSLRARIDVFLTDHHWTHHPTAAGTAG